MNSGFGLLSLPAGPLVMGSLSISADALINQSVAHGEYMMRDGASILGVGYDYLSAAETSKPSVQKELDRVIPVIEALAKRIAIPISVCTSNPDVMLAAVNAGAKMVNDILALTKPGAASMVAKLGVPVCLMHNQQNQIYNDIVKDVYEYLEQRIIKCKSEGINQKNIIIDPGFGFGKNLQHNLNLLKNLQIFKNLNCYLLVGLSNKSMIGQILDEPVEQRLYGSIAAEVIAVSKGADIILAHQVKATVDAINVVKAISD